MASIYKRGKAWAYKVYYYENGKQKAVSKSGFKTKAAAKDAAILRENEMLQIICQRANAVGRLSAALEEAIQRRYYLYRKLETNRYYYQSSKRTIQSNAERYHA